jgi:hypothetical protein
MMSRAVFKRLSPADFEAAAAILFKARQDSGDSKRRAAMSRAMKHRVRTQINTLARAALASGEGSEPIECDGADTTTGPVKIKKDFDYWANQRGQPLFAELRRHFDVVKVALDPLSDQLAADLAKIDSVASRSWAREVESIRQWLRKMTALSEDRANQQLITAVYSAAHRFAEYYRQQSRGQPNNLALNTMLMRLARVFSEHTNSDGDWLNVAHSNSRFVEFARLILCHWFDKDLCEYSKLSSRLRSLKRATTWIDVRKKGFKHQQLKRNLPKNISSTIAEVSDQSRLARSRQKLPLDLTPDARSEIPKRSERTAIDATGRRRRRWFGRYRAPSRSPSS